MKSVNIILDLKNAKYAESLARGLCYEYAGLNIFFEDNKKSISKLISRGILITDKLVENEAKTIFLSQEGDENYRYCILKISPIKKILEAIKTISQKEYGIEAYIRNQETKTVGVFSKRGGSGVTTFGIVLGRILAAKTERKVLYLNLGIVDDYSLYAGISNYDVCNKMEYCLLKEEGIPLNIENYCVEDSWGVYYFRPESNMNSLFLHVKRSKLMSYIINEKFFSYVIIDYGKCNLLEETYLEHKFEIRKGSVIYSDCNGNKTISYELCMDETDTVSTDKKNDISMKGQYANSVDIISVECDIVY